MEVVRAIYDDWLGGGMALDRFDPDIAMVESKLIPGAPSAYGIDAVRRYIDSFPNYWDEIRFEPQEYIDAGDQVVVMARLVGRARAAARKCSAPGHMSGPCEQGERYAWRHTLTEQRPSKPWAWGDRGCRRRTSK